MALAIGPTGAWGGNFAENRTTAERARNALQKCEHFGQQPCLLVLSDGKPTGETVPRARTLTYPSELDIGAIPFVRDASQMALRQGSGNSGAYPGLRDYKAIAVGLDGNFGYASGLLTEKDAADKALGFCAGQNNVKCFVYAIGNKVVFTPQTRP